MTTKDQTYFLNRLFSAKVFFAFSALFIVYATTIPWDMSHAPSFDRVSWIPGWDTKRGRIWSIPDMVQNVVLFVPFGFFAFFSLSHFETKRPWARAMFSGLVGLGLSFFVECLQTMSETRSPSATDLATNFMGSLLGGTSAALYLSRWGITAKAVLEKTARERPGVLVLGLYLLAIVGGSLAPFIPTLDIGSLRAHVRALLNNPWGPKPLGGLFTDGLLFGALAFLAALEIPPLLAAKSGCPKALKSVGPTSSALVWALMGALALGIECAQLILIGHSPGLQDVLVACIASLGGVTWATAIKDARLKPAAQLGELTRLQPHVVLSFAVLAPALRALQPFEFEPLETALASVSATSFVPFWSLFQNLNLSTFRNVFEAAAFYLPLGYAVYVLRSSPKLGFGACLTLALVLELMQIPVAGRVFDITEGIYAGAMGLVGAHLYRKLSV